MMSSMFVSIGCLVLTVIIYYLNKSLYRRWRLLLLMPLVFTPLVLIILLLTTHISCEDYIGETIG